MAVLRRRPPAAGDGDGTALALERVPARSRERAKEFVQRLRSVPEAEREAVAASLSELAEIGTASAGGLRHPPLPRSKRRVPPKG